MQRKSVNLVLSICILVFGIAFGSTTPSSFSLGENIFKSIGLPIWSDGVRHWHYPVFVALGLIVIGLLWAKRYLSRKKLVLVLVLALLLTHWLVLGGRLLYLKNSYGLAAVEYNRQQSVINAKTSPDSKNIELSGDVHLTNYGKEPISLQMAILPKSYEMESKQSWFTHEISLYEVTNNSYTFTLNPGEKRQIAVTALIQNEKGFKQLSGTRNGPDLLISNEQGQKLFVQY